MPRGLTRRRAEVNTDTDDDPTPDDSQDVGRPTTRRRPASDDSGRSTSRRSSTPVDDDTPPPRSGRRSPDRKRGGDEDDEATPVRASSGKGWDGYKKAKAKASKWNSEDKFTVDDKGSEELIAFLDDAPFCTWNEHFLRELDGKKSWTCLDDDCPICGRGDTPGYRAAFNVVAFDDKGNPSVKYWIATPGPLDEIEDHAHNERYGPLNKEGNYFVVSKKKGKNNYFKYKVERITEDQMHDEFGFDPLTEEEFTELEAGAFEEKDVLVVSSRKELRDVVRSLNA
jgi:hypothetical protein